MPGLAPIEEGLQFFFARHSLRLEVQGHSPKEEASSGPLTDGSAPKAILAKS